MLTQSPPNPVESRLNSIATILRDIRAQGRTRLFEHEVYAIVGRAGGIEPPRHVFWPAGADWPAEEIEDLPGRKLVLKLVSPDIIHKSDANAVRIVDRSEGGAERQARRLILDHERSARVEGVLVVEFVEGVTPGFGHELFVGIRATREFGAVIAAGIGGVDMEYFAQAMRPGLATAKAVASETDGERFLSLFRRTAAYDILAGQARGHARIVSDDELRRCFAAFLELAERFCCPVDDDEPRIAELEVNPFAFRDHRLVPLDGRGRLGSAAQASSPRPLEQVGHLLEPKSIAVIGVSSTSSSLGRVVLGNIAACGFPREHLYVIKPGCESIDDVRCVPSIAGLPETADLLVVATPANQLPELIAEAAKSGKVRSAILIPGGAGETAGSEGLSAAVTRAIADARKQPGGGPVFLGPNCLGVQSEPGRYDTFFIPKHKLPGSGTKGTREQGDKGAGELVGNEAQQRLPAAHVALLSQSGAFIITRLSNLEVLQPRLAISVGNQADLTLSDFVQVVTRRDDIDVIAVYAEGFSTLDGAAFLHAVAEATKAGKLVILYKAGRTQAGRSAAAGHTAAVAGDYEVCQAAAAEVGALVVDTFKEFEQVVELAAAFHRLPIRGRRIGAITNAGYEAVGMADTTRGPRYQVQMASPAESTREQLRSVLDQQGLGRLVNVANPLDLTPMAGEDAYEACARVLLDSDEVDALLLSVVPLTPALCTTADELTDPRALPGRLPGLVRAHRKPLVFVLDCGPIYDPMALAVRSAGIPVFRTSDQAMRSLGRYLDHRARRGS